MNIVILNKSPKPIYEQIYEQLASQIVNGQLQANFCLPSIRTIARQLDISVITVKKAWEQLEHNELIYTRAGKGCFVSEHFAKQLENKKYSLAVEQLKKDVVFYKNLNLTLDELIELVKKEYNTPKNI